MTEVVVGQSKVWVKACGPVDDFACALTVAEWLARLLDRARDPRDTGWMPAYELAVQRVIELAGAARAAGWEGDLRDHDHALVLFAVCSGCENHLVPILLFKQDNNGSCFVVGFAGER